LAVVRSALRARIAVMVTVGARIAVMVTVGASRASAAARIAD
jgi:hypothetical protein